MHRLKHFCTQRLKYTFIFDPLVFVCAVRHTNLWAIFACGHVRNKPIQSGLRLIPHLFLLGSNTLVHMYKALPMVARIWHGERGRFLRHFGLLKTG